MPNNPPVPSGRVELDPNPPPTPLPGVINGGTSAGASSRGSMYPGQGFNVDLFKSNLAQGGTVQNNKYEVIVLPPAALQNSLIQNKGVGGTFTEIARDLRYRCVDASLPGVALRTMDVNRYGIGVLEKMPFTANYTDVSLSFMCDRWGLTHNFWYGWLNYVFSVNGRDGNPVFGKTANVGPNAKNSKDFYTTEYKDNYASNIQITIYDNSGMPSLIYTLHKAFPVTISDSVVSWDQTNTLLKVTTTLTFREWSFQDVTIK